MKFTGYTESSFQTEMYKRNKPMSGHLDSVAKSRSGDAVKNEE